MFDGTRPAMRSTWRGTGALTHLAILSSRAVFPLSPFAWTGLRAQEACTMKENRTEIRFDLCLTARWQGSAANRNVRISDLSQGGCYVDTVVEVIVGETLFLQILMPAGEWFELKGLVAHHTPRLGFGVRFVNLDEKQHHQICLLLRIQNASPVESSDTSDCRETLIPLEQIDLTSRIIM